jgi:hypothetical protein
MYHFSKPSWIGFKPRQVMRARLTAMHVMSQLTLRISCVLRDRDVRVEALEEERSGCGASYCILARVIDRFRLFISFG